MGQRPSASFDLSRFTTATKILVGAGFLALVNSFISWWQRVSFCGGIKVPGVSCSISVNALSGSGSWAGWLMFLGLIALIAWELAYAFGALSNVGLPVPAARISAYIAAWVLLFGVIKFLLALNHVFIGDFVGLILLLAIAYGAYMRWQEPVSAAGPPPGTTPPSSGGGFTA